MVTDDYEHLRYTYGRIVLAVYSDCLPFPDRDERARLDLLEEEALQGRRGGFLHAQDTKHKGLELKHDISQASSSAPLYCDCFDAGQARFSAPQRPLSLAVGAPVADAPADLRGVVGVLKAAVVMTSRQWGVYSGKRCIAAAWSCAGSFEKPWRG